MIDILREILHLHLHFNCSTNNYFKYLNVANEFIILKMVHRLWEAQVEVSKMS